MRKRSRLSGAVAGVVFTTALAGASPAIAAYGAIAYSASTGKYGYSYNYDSQKNAERAALKHCKVSSCKVVLWYKNACGVVAKGDTGWGAAWAGSRTQASANAIKACSTRSRNCKAVVWSCSG